MNCSTIIRIEEEEETEWLTAYAFDIVNLLFVVSMSPEFLHLPCLF